MKEKEPRSMEEWANKITDKLEKEHGRYILEKEYGRDALWDIIFDAICLFQELQDEKERDLKEEHEEEKLEKERQEGK